MSAILRGPIDMTLARDKDGYKDYTIVWKIETTSYLDGPYTVINCPTLPDIGTTWSFGNDLDDWVWCIPDTRIAPIRSGNPDDPARFWTLEQTFTNRPMWRCQTTEIEEPWLEPPRVSGSYVKFTKEIRYDRHGKLVKSSSHEMITGPDVEFDDNRPTVAIEINSLTLDLSDITSMIDTVNDAPLWGLSARKIKLSNVSWARRLYGVCTFYYTIAMEFDVNFDTFDRTIADIGTRHINPKLLGDKKKADGSPVTITPESPLWDVWGGVTYTPPRALKDIPSAFTKILDKDERELGWTILDGKGRVAGTPDSDRPPGEIKIEYYPESNFLLLGIPPTLGS